MQARIVSPVEALRIVAERCHGPEPVRIPVQSARNHYLTDAVRTGRGPQNERRQRIASSNGYGLPVGFRGGRLKVLSRRLDTEEGGTMGDFPDTAAGDSATTLEAVERFETGDTVGADVACLLPIRSARVIGRGVIEVDPEVLPAPGFGIVAASVRSEVPAGTLLSARAQAALLAADVREVRVRPSWTVGVASVGAELVDLLTVDLIRTGEKGRAIDRVTGDSTGFWLPAAIEDLGLEPQSFGSVADEPAAIERLLHRAERLGLRTCVLSGGLGEGIGDRTVETVRSNSFHIHFEGLALEPGGRLLFAQGYGFDLFVLGGRPLDAAIGFDLIVRPALLYARGAGVGVWDWSHRTLPRPNSPEAAASPQNTEAAGSPPDRLSWRVNPGRRFASHDEPRQESAESVEDPFSPWISGQVDWTLESPPGSAPPRSYRVPGAQALVPRAFPRKSI